MEERRARAPATTSTTPRPGTPAPESRVAWQPPKPAWRGTCWERRRPSTPARARRRRRPRILAAIVGPVAEQAGRPGHVEERLVERRAARPAACTDRRSRAPRSLTSLYSAWSPGRNTACGHRRRATADGSAEWTPYRRASYDAAATTPRGPVPPTTTGLPRSSGRRRSSTDTKNASMSTCRITRADVDIRATQPPWRRRRRRPRRSCSHSRTTSRKASLTMPLESFDSPTVRSRNVIGNSTIRATGAHQPMRHLDLEAVALGGARVE